MKRKRSHLKAPESLALVIERSGESRFSRQKLPISAETWKRTVGARIADRAKPWGLDRGVLTIHTATSAWAAELSMLAPTILERLRSFSVSVTSLRFRVAPVEPPRDPIHARATRLIPKPRPLDAALAHALTAVDDDALRLAIADAAAAHLAWSDHTSGNPTKRVANAKAAAAPQVAGTKTVRRAPK